MQGPRGQTSGPTAARELAQGVRGPGEELRMPCRLALCDPGAQTRAERLSSLPSPTLLTVSGSTFSP